jgi:endonuclease YncB( thermonuclease family)
MLRLILAVLIVSGMWSAAAAPIEPTDIQVTDGDTIRARGKTYRLVGFDTPEMARRAQCNAERTKGHRAAIRLIELIEGGDLDLTEVRCSCRPSHIGTKRCNYGRSCAKLTAKGKDVGEILASEGLARPLHCTKTKCDPIQSWCQP